MSIDPADDCTFWYTNEYKVANGQFNWHTWIASFKYPSCTTCTDPGQPTIDSITDDDACAQSGVTITYTAGSGASSHDLYVDGSLAVSGFTSGSTYDPGDTASHSYVIRALDGTCYTDSAAQTFTDEDDTPATPAAPTVTDLDACALTGVEISWSSVTGATAYDLLVNGTTTISGVTSPYTYTPGDSAVRTYQVRGRNATCTGSWSASTSASDGEAVPPATPAAPTVTDNSACALTGLTVSWSAVANATSYDVWEDGVEIATGITGTSYSRNPGDSASHTYQVQANNSCGQSSGLSGGTSGADADHSFTFDGIQTATDRDACDDTGVVLTWNAPASWNDGGSGTHSFEVWRDGTSIATGISESSTSYNDISGTNGTSYAYSIRAVNGFSCATDGSASLSTADQVGSPPSFGGLSSVTTLSDDRCGLKLKWSAATPNCGDSVVYNVYRSTTSGFTPDATTLLASCVPDLFYEDTTVTGGTTYYYVVRAEDDSAGHGGLCNSGYEDTNTVDYSGVVSSGMTTVTLYADDFDGNQTPANYWHTGYSFGNPYSTGTCATETYADDWHIPESGGTCNGNKAASNDGAVDPAYSSPNNGALVLGDPPTGTGPPYTDGGIVLPADATSITLTFNHEYDFESADWDGGRVMISVDDWPNFTVITPAGGYPGTTVNSTLYCHPWPGEAAYVNSSGDCLSAEFDLTPYAGQRIWLVWNHGADNYATANDGWFIDDVLIEAVVPGTACTSTPDPVRSFTARAGSGQVKLEWVNPSGGAYGSTKICRDTAGYPDPATCTPIATQAGTPGVYDTFTDTGLTNGTTYYYTAFVDDGTEVFSAAETVPARPFDTTASQAKWAYSSAATALAPTGVRPGAIGTGGTWAVSNDRMLHGMNPTAAGGDWPRTGTFSWTPAGMNGPAQARPPVVPTTVVTGASQVIFLGSEDGHAYAVNAETGATLWQSPALGNILLASPSGIFTDFGGAHDLLFIGSRDATADNVMYMLDPADGTIVSSFNNGGGAGGIGIISSAATVDYATNRLYFATRERSGGSSDTLWCLNFTGTTFTKVWSVPLGDIDGAPVLYAGRLYVGNNSGIVYAIDPADGSTLWQYATTDGPVKGYVTPEAVGTLPRKLFFSTTNRVWALTDNGTSAAQAWQQTGVAGPSIPLVPFGGSELYVGSSDGRLYQLGAADGGIAASVLLGDGTATIGSPALDVINNMAYVGSESGAVYGIALPLQ